MASECVPTCPRQQVWKDEFVVASFVTPGTLPTVLDPLAGPDGNSGNQAREVAVEDYVQQRAEAMQLLTSPGSSLRVDRRDWSGV